MIIDNKIINWLLEEINPYVRVRTLTELCDFPEDHEEVKNTRNKVIQTLQTANDLSWMELKGLKLIYNLTALAEAGLTRKDVPIDPVVDKLLDQSFDAGCGDMMTLRALIMLGYGTDLRVNNFLVQSKETQLEDGGWLCLHRVRKMNKQPKSCIKAAMHGLLMAGELKKRGLDYSGSSQLIDYFLKRRLFYRTDNPTQLVLNCRPGLRMIDVLFPTEVMHVGLPMLLEALAVLGVGQAPELQEAWGFLEDKLDKEGRILLEGTLNKSYLPKERIGKPSKWGTLYAYLAWKHKTM